MRQMMLPMPLKCMNPPCTDVAQVGQYFCSDICYARVFHSGHSHRTPMKHETHPARQGDISHRTAITYPDGS